MARAAEHVGGREAGEVRGGPVPVHDAPGPVDDVQPVLHLVEDARVGEPREHVAVRPHWQSPPGS